MSGCVSCIRHAVLSDAGNENVPTNAENVLSVNAIYRRTVKSVDRRCQRHVPADRGHAVRTLTHPGRSLLGKKKREEEEASWRRTPGQKPKDLKGKDDPAVLAKQKEAGETRPAYKRSR